MENPSLFPARKQSLYVYAMQDQQQNLCDPLHQVWSLISEPLFKKGQWFWFIAYGTRCKFYYDRDVSHNLAHSTKSYRLMNMCSGMVRTMAT